MRPARVEVFGLIRPGQIYEVPPAELAAFVAKLTADDRDFFEVLDYGDDQPDERPPLRCDFCHRLVTQWIALDGGVLISCARCAFEVAP